MAEKDTTGDATTEGTGSKPETSSTPGNLADRLMQAVSPVFQNKNTPRGAPEPVILEEHVVEKSPMQPPAGTTADDVGLALPKPSPQASISLVPKQMTAAPAPKPENIPPEKTLPSSIALPPLPDEVQPAPLSPAAAPQASRPTPPPPSFVAPPPSPIAAMTSQQEPAAQTNELNNDIERILSQVKLPERREFKAAADPKPAAEAPKDLSALVTKPPINAEMERAEMARPDASAISSVHTLKDDLQHVVKDKKMSLVRAVALEQDKKRDEILEEEFGRKERRKRMTGILFASFLLFGLGFAAIFGVYLVMMSHSATSIESLNSIVFAEQSVALPLDNSTPPELKRRIAAARQSQIGSLGSITRIVPLFQGADPNAQPAPATTEQFFRALGLNAPDDLVRSVGNTFFFGLHVVDKNAPVLVIPVTNYDRAFAGMLAWEATMNPDLAPAFTPVPTTILDANGIPSARVFQDDVMRNYDVREIKDDSGTIELYYSFPSKNLLIIAESPYSFPELLSRLQSVRRL